MLHLTPALMDALPEGRAFDHLLAIPGVVHREVKNRRTVEFDAAGRRYFVKAQRGVGWGEIFKNLVSFRLPIVSARTEWLAIERAHAAGIATLTISGRGLRGLNPAALESFLVTEALEGMVSLEQLAERWHVLPPTQRVLLKRALIARVAEVSRKLHGAGVNHRDFYICHFLVRDRDWSQWKPGDELELVLIDLHRAQRRRAVPRRWLAKDLGGLFFSAMDSGLTRRDLFRFMATYRGSPLRDAIRAERGLWRHVNANAINLYRSVHKREPNRWK